MAGKLADGVNVLVENEAGELHVLKGGDTVPSWASEQVGDHCYQDTDGKAPAKKTVGRSGS